MTLGDQMTEWVGGFTHVDGFDYGKPWVVEDWQCDWLHGAFGPDVNEAALSVARGAGKSRLEAAIATAVLPGGPLHQPRANAIIVASTHGQGLESIFEPMIDMAQQRWDIDQRSEWSLQSTVNHAMLKHKPSGARAQVLGLSWGRSHGLIASLVILDEGQAWKHAEGEKAVAALRTSRGKMPNFRLHAISTMPRQSDHWFSVLAAEGADYRQVHQAEEDDDPFDEATWLKAFPSLRDRPDMLQVYREEAAKAQDMPELLHQFRALRLNMGTSETGETYALSRGTLESLETDEDPQTFPRRGGYLLGLDLSSSRDMTGVCALWPDGTIRAYAVLPKVPDLVKRGKRDKMELESMHAAGDLRLMGSRVVDIDEVIATIATEWGSPSAVVSDTYRKAQLETALDRYLPSPERIWRRNGPHDGSEDLGNLRKAAFDRRIRWPRSKLQRFSWSRLRTTESKGNEYALKESGGKRRPGDDMAMAVLLATSEQVRRDQKPRRRRRQVRGGFARAS